MQSTGKRTRSVTIEVRFTPDEAERVRAAVKASGSGAADYILGLIVHRPHVTYDLSAVALMSTALSQLAHVTDDLRKLDANIARSMGLLKSLFLDHPVQADANRAAINDAFRKLSDLDDAVMEKLGQMIPEIAEPRDEIARVMRMVLADNEH